MGNVELGTQSVFFQFLVFMFMIPLGISKAAAFYIGGCVSGGHFKSAKIYGIYTILLWFVIISVIISIVYYDPNV